MKFGGVAIGRNEGERLMRCLGSLSKATDMVVYVDSGSTDGSVQWARSHGADVVELDMDRPVHGRPRPQCRISAIARASVRSGLCPVRRWGLRAGRRLGSPRGGLPRHACGRRRGVRAAARAPSRAIGLQLAVRSGMARPAGRGTCVQRRRHDPRRGARGRRRIPRRSGCRRGAGALRAIARGRMAHLAAGAGHDAA